VTKGVTRHYPGEPRAGYIAPWEETPDWEWENTAWIGQIFRHFPDPKPAYVADWDDMPLWQQETDADIFERIERDTGHQRSQ
jgi:hypothetical protein